MSTIMDEYAIWFFVLLEEAYKIIPMEMLRDANVVSVPHMKESDRKRFIGDLERSQRDIIDLGHNDDYSALDSLKKNLGTKPN